VNHNKIGDTSFKRKYSPVDGVTHFTGKRHQEFVCIDLFACPVICDEIDLVPVTLANSDHQ
jgi:hypothetical protein